MGKSRFLTLLVSLGLVVMLPLIGNWLRESTKSGCALDGRKIDPAYRVRIRQFPDKDRKFCGLHCAELWLARHGRESCEIFVTDESSGEEILATEAFFVRSLAVTMKSTRNRVHVFKDESAAKNHANLFRGTLLGDVERPFANRL